ncbi:YezD family protein [Geomonas propionica]|uniref:YezD family protein n=1 Tax=Geomonas propionica TaxID=2798582 RepID=A0ABS0YWD0_9BACT|nr:YezD family protein [Geomonas propionica]MBJ6802290.1 YezD family protein [Geomonas propionica]
MAATTEQPGKLSEELEQRLRMALKEIRFGTVTLVIQDGKVIQLDKSEKIRIQ